MRVTDYAAHNAEVKRVWDAYRARKPVRVPMTIGSNPRYSMAIPEANPRRITFRQFFEDPQLNLERQLEHQEWVRFNLPADHEMGPVTAPWEWGVHLMNVFEAAWLGCEVEFLGDFDIPDTRPMLTDDRKNLLFDRGIPDPFTGGLMKRNWEFYDYFADLIKKGWTWSGQPLTKTWPAGNGTDGPMTVACNLRGAAEFAADLLEDPEYAWKLLDFITEAAIVRITAYRKRLGEPAKSSGWWFADDSVQLISTPMYERMIFPFHKRLVETFSDGGPGGIHLCGDATRHFPFIRDRLNVQSFDTGFPVDFGRLREMMGPDVEIYGGPSVPMLSTATPAQVRDETRRILGSGIMNGGRFVLREGNNLAPGVPVANVEAMYEAVKKWGRY